MTDAALRDPWTWRARILDGTSLPVRSQTRPLAECSGRVLAADLPAPIDLPAVAVSAMDGFAVRSSDLAPAGPTVLPVRGDHPAAIGAVPSLPVGCAARIMTGAPIPAGADLVVPVERTDAVPTGPVPSRVEIGEDPRRRAGRHVRAVGEEVARGRLLAAAGEVVRPALIGLAATLGIDDLEVRVPPRVDVVVTGDELLAGDQAAVAGHGAVRESNGLMLRSALAALGIPGRTWQCGDRPAELEATLTRAAAEADLVLTTGGIGHGAYDVVKELLDGAGAASSEFVHLDLRPGGPQGRGVLPDGTPVLHLPGTPVGALVGFHLFVRPLLAPGAVSSAVRIAAVPGEGMRGRRRDHDGGVLALPARRTAAGEAELLPGARLTPFARAELLVLAPGAVPEPGQECPALFL